MEIEDGEALPPPPPGPAPGADMRPARPPADYDAAAAYADPAAYEAYLQSSVAYQACRLAVPAVHGHLVAPLRSLRAQHLWRGAYVTESSQVMSMYYRLDVTCVGQEWW